MKSISSRLPASNCSDRKGFGPGVFPGQGAFLALHLEKIQETGNFEHFVHEWLHPGQNRAQRFVLAAAQGGQNDPQSGTADVVQLRKVENKAFRGLQLACGGGDAVLEGTGIGTVDLAGRRNDQPVVLGFAGKHGVVGEMGWGGRMAARIILNACRTKMPGKRICRTVEQERKR